MIREKQKAVYILRKSVTINVQLFAISSFQQLRHFQNKNKLEFHKYYFTKTGWWIETVFNFNTI